MKNVVLLMANLRQAAKLSNVFRKVGVVPALYRDGASFWEMLSRERPTLCLLDVSLLAREEGSLLDHPEWERAGIPLAFFCAEKHRPLLHSTYRRPGLGIVFEDLAFEGQIKGILGRVNEINTLRSDLRSLEGENARLERKAFKLADAAEGLERDRRAAELLEQWCLKLDLCWNGDSFWTALGDALGSLSGVGFFAALELSEDGHSLNSPRLVQKNFRTLASLRPRKVCTEGMQFFVQNMASQVALDELGGEVVSLVLRGRLPHPEAMIFLQVRESELLENFNWRALERALGGVYRHFLLRDTREREVSEGTNWGPWELFSFLDSQDEARLEEELALLNVNFAKLLSFAGGPRGTGFFRKKFFSAFFGRFAARKIAEFQSASVGPEDVALLAKREDIETLRDALSAYAKNFPYWRYFEQSDVVLAKNLAPSTRVLSPNAAGYGKFLRSETSGTFNHPGKTQNM